MLAMGAPQDYLSVQFDLYQKRKEYPSTLESLAKL
jgi:hypothetical protein